jgi:methionyl-tRNA synthetase
MRFFLTTAIDYVNSRPHLGTAYEKVTADVIARYKRLAGFDTRFLMGNDEHSQNVFRRARELGQDPVAYCDDMERIFREVWAGLSVSFDDFIRTTEPRHRAGVQRMVQVCADAGDVYPGYYEGWYCVSCEAFKQEKDLVDGLCPVHLRQPEWIREKNYFFRLSKYRDALLAHFAAHPEFLQPDVRRNEILRLLEGGLDDISISRAGQAWGIPLPFDAESVVYVWFDALINYASAVGYGTDDELFATWWPADLHVIGKDITRFHCVVWPAMLMSAGLPVPRQVFGHGWVHFKGQRMSKSLGTTVDPLDAAGRIGADPLRLYLVKEIPYGGLANNLGNLVSRVSAMADRYRSGALSPSPLGPGRLAAVAEGALTSYRAAMDRFALHEGVSAAYRLVDATNEFIAESEPWVLAKDASAADRLNQVLYDAAEAVRLAAVWLMPVMPASCAEILRRAGDQTPAGQVRLSRDGVWQSGRARTMVKGPALWPRLDAPAAAAGPVTETLVTEPQPPAPHVPTPAAGTGVDAQASKPSGAAETAPAPPPAPAPAGPPRVTIDQFMALDLRVAKVLTAERVPKSKKLVKMSVDVGTETRTLVAGIAEAYEPEALVGRTVVIVANLQPATLMGIESNGMVLAASPDGGKPELVGFVTPPAPGTRVR